MSLLAVFRIGFGLGFWLGLELAFVLQLPVFFPWLSILTHDSLKLQSFDFTPAASTKTSLRKLVK